MNLGLLHRNVGGAIVVAFLATGFYMRFGFPELYDGNEVVRFQFRANHIYLLLAGLLNVLVGLYVAAAPAGWRRHLQHAGSVILLLAPIALLVAFFIEPPRGALFRPLTTVTMIAMVVATLLHVPARRRP